MASSTPSYVTLISGIVTTLQNDARMSDVPDAFIYFGPDPQIPKFPAVTVELTNSMETWRSFPTNKDSISTIIIRAFDESLGYADGLQKVENLVKNISDTLQANRTISGIAYQTDILSKRFSPGTYENIPIFGCEIQMEVKQRFGVST
jgi:hypothetical protein